MNQPHLGPPHLLGSASSSSSSDLLAKRMNEADVALLKLEQLNVSNKGEREVGEGSKGGVRR